MYVESMDLHSQYRPRDTKLQKDNRSRDAGEQKKTSYDGLIKDFQKRLLNYLLPTSDIYQSTFYF